MKQEEDNTALLNIPFQKSRYIDTNLIFKNFTKKQPR